MPLFRIPGVHVSHHKDTASMPAIKMTNVRSVSIPTVMHIGTPASPIVNIGDTVSVGQLIAEPMSPFSAPIHSSISGTVKKIDNILQSNGNYCQSIVIESDGLMTVCPDIKRPIINSYDDFIKAVRYCGVVGLGGAGFPTSVKLDIKDLSRLDAVVINGAECEPYITSDTRVMLDYFENIKIGVENLNKFLKVKKFIIGIEKNKPECIKKMREMASHTDNFEVKVLPSLYPQGHEKVLIYQCCKKIVPEGKLPIDAGVIVLNCATLAKIGDYINTGMPLVEKLVTVSGSAVKKPQNLLVPIGTSLEDVFNFCGGFKEEPKKILYGGPMMGIAVPDLNAPIMKNTNAVLAFGAKEAEYKEETQCINCGNCVRHCPMGLNPVEIEKAYKAKEYKRLIDLKPALCMECGCCSYICPAHKQVTQYNKLAKAALRNYLNAEKAKNERKVEKK